jgi:hypothetical protein
MNFLSNSKKMQKPMSPAELAKLSPSEVVMTSKTIAFAGKVDGVAERMEEHYLSPLSVGIARGHPGYITDEEWANGASLLLKKLGSSRYLIRMISLLRHELQGKAFKPLPLPTELCPCKSRKRYSECCGIGVEEGDPPECKKGNHAYSVWKTTEKGRLVRGCWNCSMLEEAPWAADTEINGLRVVLIGCKYCAAIPSIDNALALVKECEQYDLCAYCGKAIGFKSLHIQHKYEDGLHIPEWTITEAEWNPLIDFSSEALQGTQEADKGVTIHDECLKKAFPFWDKLTTDKFTKTRMEQYSFLRVKKEPSPHQEPDKK